MKLSERNILPSGQRSPNIRRELSQRPNLPRMNTVIPKCPTPGYRLELEFEKKYGSARKHKPRTRIERHFRPIKSAFVHWEMKQSCGHTPEARENSRGLVIKDTLFLVGGQSHARANKVHVMGLQNCFWQRISVPRLPGRSGHSLVTYNETLVMYGGILDDGEITADVCLFNTVTLECNTINERNPLPRRNHAADSVGKHMLVYGGVLPDGSKSKEFMVFDLITHTWIISELDIPLSHCTLTAVLDTGLKQNPRVSFLHLNEQKLFTTHKNSGVYLFGGCDSYGQPCNTLYEIFGAKGTIKFKEVRPNGMPPIPRYSHAAAAVNNLLVVYGGRNESAIYSSNYGALNDLHIFNVNSLKWEQVLIGGESPKGRWGHWMCAYKTGVLMFGGMTHKEFLSPEVYYLETDQKLAEIQKRRDIEEETYRNYKKASALADKFH